MDRTRTEEELLMTGTAVSIRASPVEAELLNRLPAAFARHNGNVYTYAKRSSPLKKNVNRMLKRSFDIVFSFLMIICILSWLIPLLAVLIKLDSGGPVFFLQQRNKYAGTLFTCIKLRTMVVNEEADMLAACRNDERITRFGHFLREHFLDELPQFLNVLMGDMSIVGPRPHMLSDNLKYEKLVNNYSSRNNIKPGITGLAQVLGYCGPVDDLQKIETRINMDIFYIRHWTPGLDCIILYRTIRKALCG